MIPIPLILAGVKGVIPWRLVLWAFLGLSVALLGLSLFTWGHRAGQASTQAKWDQEKLIQASQRADALAQALQVQQSLQSLIDQAGKDRQHEIARIAHLHAAAVDSLRNRPEARAAAGVPTAAEPGAGCTGAGLAGPDGRFLAGYAADAARLQAALDQCRAGYQAAQRSLDAIEKDTGPAVKLP